MTLGTCISVVDVSGIREVPLEAGPEGDVNVLCERRSVVVSKQRSMYPLVKRRFCILQD